MSATPVDDDRDDDPLRRAQRAHEPSMEEILASIRAIIADDRGPASAKTPAPVRPAPPAAAQVIYSNFGQKPQESVQPAVVWSRSKEAEGRADSDEPEYRAIEEEATSSAADIEAELAPEAPLLSTETDREVAASFQAFSATMSAPDPQRVEQMTRELLRPMLKAWLDENLPTLVERLVKAEIQRVARGGR